MKLKKGPYIAISKPKQKLKVNLRKVGWLNFFGLACPCHVGVSARELLRELVIWLKLQSEGRLEPNEKLAHFVRTFFKEHIKMN